MKHKYFIAYLDKVDKMIDELCVVGEVSPSLLRDKIIELDKSERVRICQELKSQSKKKAKAY